MRALTPRLTVFLALGACASETELDAASLEVTKELLRFTDQYSAYDGENPYPVVVGISRAALPAKSDVDWPSVRWIYDASFVEQTDYRVLDGSAGDDFIPVRKYDPLAGTAVFTTKRTGSTRIGVVFRTLAGEPMHGEAKLQISQASAEEWALGDGYFNKSARIMQYPDRDGLCGLPETVELEKQTNCVNCHFPQYRFSPCSPLQTARYSDDELLGTIARGELPPDTLSWSKFLQSAPDPQCVFDEWHSPDDIDDTIARGLLWKLRSMLPELPEELDLGFATQTVEREETAQWRTSNQP